MVTTCTNSIPPQNACLLLGIKIFELWRLCGPNNGTDYTIAANRHKWHIIWQIPWNRTKIIGPFFIEVSRINHIPYYLVTPWLLSATISKSFCIMVRCSLKFCPLLLNFSAGWGYSVGILVDFRSRHQLVKCLLKYEIGQTPSIQSCILIPCTTSIALTKPNCLIFMLYVVAATANLHTLLNSLWTYNMLLS